MKNIDALRRFINDEQILEVLIEFEESKLNACKTLQGMMFDKWHITVTEAFGIIQNVQAEFNNKYLVF